MTTEHASLFIQALIAIAAFVALRQLTLTKEGLITNSRRESIKYASELVTQYLNNIIPVINKLDTKLGVMGYTTFGKPMRLKFFTREEILSADSDLKIHFEKSSKLFMTNYDTLADLVLCANLIESFATPLIEGVADEKVAFKSVGKTFCDQIERYYALYVFARENGKADFNYYANTISLFALWSNRIRKSNLRDIEKNTRDLLANIPDKVIKPIGT